MMKNVAKSTLTILGSSAAILLGATALSATSQSTQKINYEFSFQYDQQDLNTESGRRAIERRLEREAYRYCLRKMREEDARSATRQCEATVVSDVKREMASDMRSDRFARR